MRKGKNCVSAAVAVASLGLLCAPAACNDGLTGDPLVPTPIAYGEDGRRLLWKPAPGEKQCYEVDFSPDGTKLACRYSQGAEEPAELIILDVATLEITHIVPEEYCVMLPDWSPRGDWLAFQGSVSGSRAIWLCRPDGSELHRVSDGIGVQPAWNADGSRVYYAGQNTPAEGLSVKYYDLATGENVVVIAGTPRGTEYRSVIPSPDNLWLTYGTFNTGVESGHADVVMALSRIDGSSRRTVWPVSAVETDGGWPVDWSPDGRYVLLAYYSGNIVIGLWTYEVKTGVIRQLTLNPPDCAGQPLMEGSWGPNGEIAFSPHDDYGRPPKRLGWLYLIDAPR
jgi:Tol biopolymer transport system component